MVTCTTRSMHAHPDVGRRPALTNLPSSATEGSAHSPARFGRGPPDPSPAAPGRVAGQKLL